MAAPAPNLVLVTSPTAANPAVSGSTTGALDLQQSALGGAAGRSDTGTAGVAGNAVSILVVQDNTASSLSGLTQAYGGTGGSTMTGTANSGRQRNLEGEPHLHRLWRAGERRGGRLCWAWAGPRARRDKMPYPARRSPMRPSRHTAALKTPPSPVAGTLSPDDAQTSPVVVTASSEVEAQGAFASHALANTGAVPDPTDPSGDVTASFAGATASPTGVVVPGAPAGSVVLGASTITADYVTGMSGTETVTDTVTFSVLGSSLTGALLYVDNFAELGFTGSGHETTVVNALTGIDTVTLTFTATAGGAADLSGTFALLDPPPEPDSIASMTSSLRSAPAGSTSTKSCSASRLLRSPSPRPGRCCCLGCGVLRCAWRWGGRRGPKPRAAPTFTSWSAHLEQ